MLAIEPLFNGGMLGVVFHGGASIYRLTPCPANVAFARAPTQGYQLPAPILATVPVSALPPPEAAPYRGWESTEDDDDKPF